MLPFLMIAALAQAAPLPSCATTFDSLRAKVEADYAGYILEVTGARRQTYEQVVGELHAAAGAATSDLECLAVLRRFTDWFDDPHLAVLERDRHDSLETRRRVAALEFHPVTEAAVLHDLATRGGRADPIEGIWYDVGTRMAIIPDDGDPGTFLAVVLASDTVTLPVGAVRARFRRDADGRYAADLLARDLTRTHVPATLSRRILLRLLPGIWGKAAPLAPADAGLLDPADPRRPTLVIRQGVPVFTIPSHDNPYKPVLDSLIHSAARTLRSAELMVVDLRGNEGGSSQTTAPLEPYLVGADLRPPAHGFGEAMMLSSPDQVGYARRAFGPESDPFVRDLVARLSAAPGRLVPIFADPSAAPRERHPDPARGPARVAVLVDHETVSAAEVTAELAIRTDRAVLIGEPTAGALDYQSTSFARIAADESRWLLLYPTITAHAGLPRDGVRGTGIVPEIALAWDSVADPIATAIELLRHSSR